MKNSLFFMLLVGLCLGAQAFIRRPACNHNLNAGPDRVFNFKAVFQGKMIGLSQENTENRKSKNEAPKLHMLRFYLSNFVFLKNGAPVFEAKNSYHLLDLEDESSLELKFKGLGELDFDQVVFNLGIDSLTHVAGVMGGDLDPTKGMFWTWQSGYVNFKMEGEYGKCPTQNHAFQFHLGGWQAPFQSVQSVRLMVPKSEKLCLQLDLTPFFDQIDWVKKYSIMSPCKEAVAASKILANSFSVHGE